MITRRKLFSSNLTRRKLFSNYSNERKVVCLDCGYTMDTNSSTTILYCPKCGGKRFNVTSNITNVDEFCKKSENRRKLFDDNRRSSEEDGFSIPSNKLEEKLKTYSGEFGTESAIDKLFSDTGYKSKDLIEKGFACVTDDNKVKIFDTAYLQSKLFSKLIVSVTKILDLNPIDKPKEEVIDLLAEKKCMEPRNILLIKKAHGISPIMKSSEFSETNEWIEDSGIQNDLHLEFGGSQMKLDKFKNILSERYDDAPDNIIDKLSEKGIIDIQADIVKIL